MFSLKIFKTLKILKKKLNDRQAYSKKIIKRHVISVVQWFDMVNVSR